MAQGVMASYMYEIFDQRSNPFSVLLEKKKNSSSPRCHMGSQSLELELLCAVSRAAKMPKVRGLHANNTAHVSNEISGSSV